jgi:hypothetical protein
MNRTIHLLCLCVTCWLTSQSQDTPVISSDFAGGNIVVVRTAGDTIWLKPDLSETEGELFCWYFKVSNIQEAKLHCQFTLDNQFSSFGPAYSINHNHSWKWYGENRVHDHGFSYAFSPEDSAGRLKVALDLPCPRIKGEYNEWINMVGKQVSRDNARAFGRAISCALMDYLKSSDDPCTTQHKGEEWKENWPQPFQEVMFPSSLEGIGQGTMFLPSDAGKPQPLIVSLHKWSGDDRQKDPPAKLILEKGWKYIHQDGQMTLDQ